MHIEINAHGYTVLCKTIAEPRISYELFILLTFIIDTYFKTNTYFKKIKHHLLPKKEVRTFIYDENILSPSAPLLRLLNTLNVYQIKLYQVPNLIYNKPKRHSMLLPKNFLINILPNFEKRQLPYKTVLSIF